MVLVAAMALCAGLLSGCGSGIAPITVYIPALATEDLVGPCQYDLLLPQPKASEYAGKPVTGVLVIYERGDSNLLYQDQTLRDAAFALRLGILWAHQCNARSTGDLQADAGQGPGRSLFAALTQLGAKSRHPELASIGLELYGFSAAGVLTATMENDYPERVLGAMLYAAGSASTDLDDVQIAPAAARVPTLVLANALDIDSGTYRSRMYFHRGRALAGMWSFAVQSGTDHCCNLSTRSIIVPWMQAIAPNLPAGMASAPRPADSSGIVAAIPNSSFVCTPNGIVDAQGDTDCNFTAASLGPPGSAKEDTGWLPDQASGEAWLAWVTHSGTN